MVRAYNRSAKDRPVISSGETHTEEKEVAQSEPRLMKSTGTAAKSLDENVVQPVQERVMDSEKMQMMAFMNEPITIRVATTTDKQAEQVFELTIHGKTEFFRRGETKTVPRNYVGLLLRLKQTNFNQREVLNKEGVREFLHDPVTALKYDFAVVHDGNPLGKPWFDALLREPG